MSSFSFPLDYDPQAGRKRIPLSAPTRIGGQLRPGAAVPYAELDPPFLRGAKVLRGGYDGASEPMYPSAQPTSQGTLRQQNEGLLPRGPSSPGAVNAGIVTRSREAGAARVASQYGMEHAAPGAGKATMGLTEEQALQMLNVISQQNPGIPPHDLLPQFTAKLGEYGVDSQRAGHLMGQFGQGGYQFDYPQPGTGKPAGERTVMVPSAGPYREFQNGQVAAEVGGQGGTGAYQLANGSIARVGPNGQQVGSAAPGPAPATIPLQVPTAAVAPTMGPKQGYTPITPSPAPAPSVAAAQQQATPGLNYARQINTSMIQQQQQAAQAAAPQQPAINPRVAALQQNYANSLDLQNDLAATPLYGPNLTLNREAQQAGTDLVNRTPQLPGPTAGAGLQLQAQRDEQNRYRNYYQNEINKRTGQITALQNQLMNVPPSDKSAHAVIQGQIDALGREIVGIRDQYSHVIGQGLDVGQAPAAPAAPSTPAGNQQQGAAPAAQPNPQAVASSPAGTVIRDKNGYWRKAADGSWQPLN